MPAQPVAGAKIHCPHGDKLKWVRVLKMWSMLPNRTCTSETLLFSDFGNEVRSHSGRRPAVFSVRHVHFLGRRPLPTVQCRPPTARRTALLERNAIVFYATQSISTVYLLRLRQTYSTPDFIFYFLEYLQLCTFRFQICVQQTDSNKPRQI